MASLPGLNPRETWSVLAEFLIFSFFYCSGLLIVRGGVPPSQYFFLIFSCFGASLGFHYLNKLLRNPKGFLDSVIGCFGVMDIFAIEYWIALFAILIAFIAIIAFILLSTIFPLPEFSKVVDIGILLISYVATALAIAWLDWKREWSRKMKK